MVSVGHSPDESSAQEPPAARALMDERILKPTQSEMELHAARIGLPQTEIEKFFSYHESGGWRIGRNPMRSWRAAMVNWKIRCDEYRARSHKPGQKTYVKPKDGGQF